MAKKRDAAPAGSAPKTRKAGTSAARPSGAKQQTIQQSIAPRASSKRGAKRIEDEDDDEDASDVSAPIRESGKGIHSANADKRELTMSQWKQRPVHGLSLTKDDEDAKESDSEQEAKSEERGPRRTTRQVSRLNASSSGDVSLDAVMTGSFLMGAGNVSELTRRLKLTWTALQQTANQQQEVTASLEKLRLLCADLLHDKILEHGEKTVRSLAACCVVDLLRVFAPNMPFKSNEELYDAFQLLLEQVRGLAIEAHDDSKLQKTASATDLHSLYVLENLASVKSALLLVGMDYSPDENDEAVLVQLFKAFFNTIRKEHSVKIENLMLSIMVSCIEECDTIDQPLLDVILAPLVHSTPQTEVTEVPGVAADVVADRGPYHMAQELIRRTSDQLQSPISHFFNSVLVDAPATYMQKASELKEHIYTLIYEVHKIKSSLLLYVLPNVCMQLQVDEVATRSEAIALMGRLFASTHAEYGHDHMKNFRDFLGRFLDVSKEIRLQMVQASAIIWLRKPELAPMIEKEFVTRLTDTEWEVRRLAVNELCDLAANNLDVVSEECLRQVGERMKDKRVVLRKETMTGLSQVYATHVSRLWAPDADEDEGAANVSLTSHNIPNPHLKKLSWIPDYVLKCFAYPQEELKLRVIQLLDDILLPKAAHDHVRAKGLLFIYHSLDASSREALRRIMVERAKCQTLLESFLAVKKVSRKASTSPSQGEAMLEKSKDALRAGIAPLFNETDNLGRLLDQLAKWKDQVVFKQLELLCDCSKSQDDYRSARDRLIKAVGSKTPLGEFLKNFCRRLNMLTVSEGTIAAYLGFFVENGITSHKENRPVTELLLLVSKTTPQLFGRFIQVELENILKRTGSEAPARQNVDGESDEDDEEDGEVDNKVVLGLLNVIAQFSSYWKKRQSESMDDLDIHAADTMPSSTLKNYLKQCCLGAGVSANAQDEGLAAKFAARTLANFFGDAKDVGVLATKLCAKKLVVAPSPSISLSVLESLHVLTKLCPMQLLSNPENVKSLWDTLWGSYLAPSKQDEQSKLKKPLKGAAASKTADIRCLAVKVAAGLLLHCHEGDSLNLQERSRQLVQLLFDLLRSDGRLWGSSGSLPVKFRIAAACNLLRLLRHRVIESLLAASEWHILGFVMQDASEEVRRAFIKKLSANLMKASIPHPHKYVSYLVLAATETNPTLKRSARGLLGTAVERMRRVFEATSSRQNADISDNEGERQNLNALMVPEYALPYVVHLLVHHPDYPASTAVKAHATGARGALLMDPVWSDQLSYMSFFFDGLMPASSVEADNIAFLLQILTKMSDCHDVMEPKSAAMYPLVDSTVVLLKRRIKNQSNLKSFPGKIYLPKQLFRPGRVTEKTGSSSLDDEHKSEESEPTKGMSRLSEYLSPIKASGSSMFMDMSSPQLSAQKRRSSVSSSASKPKRQSLMTDPAFSQPSTTKQADDGEAASRRQSLSRKASAQAKTFVDMSSESEDDSDHFVRRASVASRAKKSVEAASTDPVDSTSDQTKSSAPTSTPTKRKRSLSASDTEEKHEEPAAVEEQAPTTRASRRQRKT